MSNESSEKGSGNRIGLTVAIVVALILYVLSPLPVLLAMERWFGINVTGPDNWCSRVIQVVYFPLIFADQRFDLVGDFYDHYGRMIGYP